MEGLSQLKLQIEYRSDQDNIIDDFYVVCMRQCILYKRAVGYFTSRGISLSIQGIKELVNNNGKMMLVVNPHLEREDIEAITKGYINRNDAIESSLNQTLDSISDETDFDRFRYLATLIATDRLDVKIAIPVDENGNIRYGIYHEKIGIFTDSYGESVAFIGSPNETAGGLINNFESIDVYWSWDDQHARTVKKIDNFKRLWENSTNGLEVIDFPEAVRQKWLEIIEGEYSKKPTSKNKTPKSDNGHQSRKWRHQDEALKKFINEERGILEMATGTGKTRTALLICAELANKNLISKIIITTDGNDLMNQWYLDLLSFRKEGEIFTSINRHYESYRHSDRFLLSNKNSVLIVSRANLSMVLKSLDPKDSDKLILIHDEVHRLGSQGNQETLKGLTDNIRFRLGLSATPERKYDEIGTNFIREHIGPVIYKFNLDEAIKRGILSPFNYYPLDYEINAEDKDGLKQVYKEESAKKHSGNPMSPKDKWIKISRVYKTSRAKLPIFDAFISEQQDLLKRCIIFVEEMKYGDEVLELVHKYRHDFHTYYSNEDRETLQKFANGQIQCLITCHRLSEGIDIKSLTTVILFSSASTRLETIQRMGRCLRSDPDNPQKRANVIDFIRIKDRLDDTINSDTQRREMLTPLSQIELEEL